MIVVDDFSSITQGDTLTPFSPTFVTLDSTGKLVPLSLSGLTISMEMTNERGDIKTCSGTWTIVDATAGQAQYAWQPGDVDTAGTWTMYIKLTQTSSGKFVHGETKTLEVLKVPS